MSLERVVLVHVNFPSGKMAEDIEELNELAISAGADIVAVVTATRRVPDAKLFVGTGKANEIAGTVAATGATLAIFNHVLTPAQERNLERIIKCRIVDRTGLILDIFAQRARSSEGKLQVELAMLNHLATRLVRGWTHLERQRGGIGLRGPGETQLEVDRRLIRNRIKQITARLNKIRKQRAQGRRSRRKATMPTVALVGYTNAGKSTLFNRLTGSDVYVADQLFATLDPTLRRIDVPEIGSVILADTVGFIRHLPHDLIEAFQATLEEVSQADLLLHVVDVHDENRNAHIAQVKEVLTSIHAEDVPTLMVYNKIDLDTVFQPGIERGELGQVKRVYISATKNTGMTQLVMSIAELIGKDIVEREIVLRPDQAKLRSVFYNRDVVISEKTGDDGHCYLVVRMPRVELDKLLS